MLIAKCKVHQPSGSGDEDYKGFYHICFLFVPSMHKEGSDGSSGGKLRLGLLIYRQVSIFTVHMCKQIPYGRYWFN